jgi:hypothetical protein
MELRARAARNAGAGAARQRRPVARTDRKCSDRERSVSDCGAKAVGRASMLVGARGRGAYAVIFRNMPARRPLAQCPHNYVGLCRVDGASLAVLVPVEVPRYRGPPGASRTVEQHRRALVSRCASR